MTSVFLYVDDVLRSVEFYNEIAGAEVVQVHAENEGGPITLAILRLGEFTLMLHPQEPHAAEFDGQRVGLGIHLQLRVDDVDAFYQHCMDQGAMLSVSGEPVEQPWGWREFRAQGPGRLRLVRLPGQIRRALDLTGYSAVSPSRRAGGGGAAFALIGRSGGVGEIRKYRPTRTRKIP